jgi:flagellar hook-length control protein FliK
MSQEDLTAVLDDAFSLQEGAVADDSSEPVAFTPQDVSGLLESTSLDSQIQPQVAGETVTTESISTQSADGSLEETVLNTTAQEETEPAILESQEQIPLTDASAVEEVSPEVLAKESVTQGKSTEDSQVSDIPVETAAAADDSVSLSLEESSVADSSEGDSRETGQQSFFADNTLTAEPSFAQPVTTMADFVDNMMQAVSIEQTPETVDMQQMIDIVNQVVEQIHSTMEDGATTLEMQLNPESLGKLLLSITNKSGVMTASFTVQSSEAKAAIESQMMTLRENLEQKNLKVEAVEVSVSDFAFSQSGQADGDQKEFQQGNGRRSRFRYEEDDEGSQTEETAAGEADRVRRSVMQDRGSSIDFTA